MSASSSYVLIGRENVYYTTQLHKIFNISSVRRHSLVNIGVDFLLLIN